MFKHICITSCFLLTSLNASADFIYADSFSVTQDVSQLTNNAKLSWLEGTGNSSASTIFAPNQFYHQHFGGLNSATTYDTFPGIYAEDHGSPVPQQYAALEIDFITPVRSFGFKAENHTSSPFGVFLYDTGGNFLQLLTANVVNTGIDFIDGSNYYHIFDATYTYNFGFDVGKIKIGGLSDGGYIYALNVDVPEPSTLFLFFVGLFSILASRQRNLFNK